MPQIRILPPELRNKIAAGEVIERPASIVKELTENSIDAGSTDIRIEIFKAGKGRIKVSDNGSGMEQEDAVLCLERHSTSKLRNEDDLFTITTLGFRGEALPSIASVSRMKLVTGLRGAPSGVSIETEGGRVKETKDFPAVGTSVEIRDLFFNTPARKKFLKSDSTELFHIIDAVTREALSYWEIGFSLFAESQETISLARASGPRERILQIFGLEFVEGLMEVKTPTTPFDKEGIGQTKKMTAFITKADNFRNSKSHQFLFINRRPVRDQAVSHAVYAAYEGILPHDKHPVFFLFLELDPREVDFNVHPAKREVRFVNKQDVHTFVRGYLRDAVKQERAHSVAPFAEAPEWKVSERPASFSAGEPLHPRTQASGGRSPSVTGTFENTDFPFQPSLPFLYLGDTFVAVAGKGGLTLIDHHAAHERILYETFLRGINLDSHALLFPAQVKLSPQEYRVLLEQRTLLSEMGMEVDDFGHNTLIVRRLPDALRDADIRGILADVAATLLEGAKPFESVREILAAKVACHRSVRGKEILHQEELQKLLRRLEATEHPDQCPHGRPTRIFLSLEDLKKMFKRK